MLSYEESNYRSRFGSLHGRSCICQHGDQDHQQTITAKAKERAEGSEKEKRVSEDLPVLSDVRSGKDQV